MQNLSVVLVQPDTVWENRDANLTNLSKLCSEQTADLIVLPETFSTGFSMRSVELAEPMSGPTVEWMRELARSRNSVVTGSVIISEGTNCFNRLLWVTPKGEVDFYDKRHLIALMGEDKAFAQGVTRKIFKLNGWRICPQICYDLRFPVWCRNRDDYDVLLFVANWPAARSYAWHTLLRARAIENQSYLLAVNRIGIDGNKLEFGGGSVVLDPLGAELIVMPNHTATSTVSLNAETLTKVRRDLPFLRDRDEFELNG